MFASLHTDSRKVGAFKVADYSLSNVSLTVENIDTDNDERVALTTVVMDSHDEYATANVLIVLDLEGENKLRDFLNVRQNVRDAALMHEIDNAHREALKMHRDFLYLNSQIDAHQKRINSYERMADRCESLRRDANNSRSMYARDLLFNFGIDRSYED